MKMRFQLQVGKTAKRKNIYCIGLSIDSQYFYLSLLQTAKNIGVYCSKLYYQTSTFPNVSYKDSITNVMKALNEQKQLHATVQDGEEKSRPSCDFQQQNIR